MRIINDELYDEDPTLGATPELLTGTGAPDGDAEPQVSAPKGSIYVQSDATDDTMPLWVKIDTSDTDEDWVRILAEKCSDDDVEIEGDWLWTEDHQVEFRSPGGTIHSPGANTQQISPVDELRIGGALHYVRFMSDGFMWFEGDARFTRVDPFPVGTWLEAPGGSPPDYVTLENMAGASFDIGDEIYLVWLMPWGSMFDDEYAFVRIIWYIDEAYALNSGEIQWRVAINAVPINCSEAVDAAGTEAVYDSGDENIPANAKYLTFTDIAMTDELDFDVVGIKISRIAIDDGTDPTADPVIVGVHVRSQQRCLGPASL